MPKISPTLNCLNKVNERKNKGLPIYNFGLGANPIEQPKEYIESLKKFSHKNFDLGTYISEEENTYISKYSIPI